MKKNTDNKPGNNLEKLQIDPKELIQGFICTQVTGRGLDGRTRDAYRIDLEHFYQWAEQKNQRKSGKEKGLEINHTEQIENYLEYLSEEKSLRPSTVVRKYRVLNYYLSYLGQQGILKDYRPLKLRHQKEKTENTGISEDIWDADNNIQMSKRDVDSFFLAMEREYEKLDNDFRRRICLRDLVMMELLFYHGIEVSELLRLEIRDYDQKTGILTVHKKRGITRRIYLYSKTLQKHMNMWLSEHGYFERTTEYSEKLFLSKLGKPLSMKMIINIFNKYRIAAGIEKDVTPKDLKTCMGEYAKELMRQKCGQ